MSVGQNGTGPARAATLPSDPEDLEREIAERRAHLAATVDELVNRAKPKELARRGAGDMKRRVRGATHTPDGALRKERVGALGGAAAVVVLLALARRLRRRRR